MTPVATLEVADVAAVFSLHLVHDTTSRPITSVTCRLVAPRRPGWDLAVSGGTVAVTAWDRTRVADPPITNAVISVEVIDPALRHRLAHPDVEITVDRLDDEHRFVPVPSVVAVTLVDEDGAAVTGRALALQGTSGAPEPLAETGVGGTYESAARSWPPALAEPHVLVDGADEGLILTIEPDRAVSRARLVLAH